MFSFYTFPVNSAIMNITVNLPKILHFLRILVHASKYGINKNNHITHTLNKMKCKIFGSHDSDLEGYCLLGYDAV